MARPKNIVNFDKPIIALQSEEHKPGLVNIAIVKPKKRRTEEDDDGSSSNYIARLLKDEYLKWYEENFGSFNTGEECERALAKMQCACK